jgi:hypothetical protein
MLAGKALTKNREGAKHAKNKMMLSFQQRIWAARIITMAHP